jgi:hypothetical protein
MQEVRGSNPLSSTSNNTFQACAARTFCQWWSWWTGAGRLAVPEDMVLPVATRPTCTPRRTASERRGHVVHRLSISTSQTTQIIAVPIGSAQTAERLSATRFPQVPTRNIARQPTSSAGQPNTSSIAARSM